MIRYEFDQFDAKNKFGIYCIYINGHTYIGSTKRTIWKRIKEHERLLRKNNHYNKNMQTAFNKYHNVIFFVLEYCDNKEVVCKREQYFISECTPCINIARKVTNYN